MQCPECTSDAESRVLDIGCGGGSTACYIAEHHGSGVYGVDISEVMITKARQRARQRGPTDSVEFRVADACQLSFEDGFFDVVLVESVLTPLPGDKKVALREMVRVVRPGGRIGANESTVDPSAPQEWLALLEERPAIHGYSTPQTLRQLFEESGLRVVEMSEAQYVDTPKVLKEMGLRGVLSFFIRAYPRILFQLLRDARFPKASRIDNQITKRGKEYMGYALIVGEKPA